MSGETERAPSGWTVDTLAAYMQRQHDDLIIRLDERAAYRILIKALAEPFRTIVDNAGYDASDAMAEVRLAGPGHGFDATAGRVVDVMRTGIYDPAIVLKSAAYGAVTTAALALTVDVLVHPREQPERASVHIPSKRKKL